MHRTMPASRGIEGIRVISGKHFYAALIGVACCRELGLNKPFLLCRQMLEMLAELSMRVWPRFTHSIEDHVGA